MTDQEPSAPLFFDYISCGDWAQQARAQLALFDQGRTQALFFAAFALRMAIETRLEEYIRAAGAKAQGYTAKDLLRRLLTKAPYAQSSFQLRFTPAEGGTATSLSFTGMPDSLVKAHAQLGDLLHASFFRTNEDWPYRMRLRDKTPPSRSLLDVRDELKTVATQVEQLAGGDLLSVTPSWVEFFSSEDK